MMQHRPSMLRITAAVALTVAAVVYIFLRVDLSELAKLDLIINWTPLGLGILTLVVIYLVHSLRWMFFFRREVRFPLACATTFIGFALNVVLPLRGGDIGKLFYLQRTAGIGLVRGATRLVYEKTLDLVVVVLLAAVAMAAFLRDWVAMLALPIGGAVLFVTLLAVVRLFPERLHRAAAYVMERLRIPQSRIHEQREYLLEFAAFLNWKNIAVPLLLTILIWFLLEYVFMSFVIRGVNMRLDYPSVLVVVAFGTLSIGLPSAPSGIGVYHAAVMSAFELLGYSAAQGLVAATALHLAITIPVLCLGGAAYLLSLPERAGGDGRPP